MAWDERIFAGYLVAIAADLGLRKNDLLAIFVDISKVSEASMTYIFFFAVLR